MKIKLDENLPHRLVRFLAELGHDVDTVFDERLVGRDDEVVWNAAQADGRFLITQDLDFSDARKYMPGTHHGLLLVRLRSLAAKRCSNACRRSSSPRTWRLGPAASPVPTANKVRVRRATS